MASQPNDFHGSFEQVLNVIGVWPAAQGRRQKDVRALAFRAHTDSVTLGSMVPQSSGSGSHSQAASSGLISLLYIGLIVGLLVACKVDGHYIMPDSGGGSDATPIDTPPVGDGNVSCALRVAFQDGTEGKREIWVANPDGTGLVNVSNSPADDLRPSWAPDGKRILFESNRSGNFDIWVVNADGSGLKNLTEGSTATDQQAVWSPDGQRIAFVRNLFVWTMNADGTGAMQLSTLQQMNDVGWSSDSTRVIFGTPRSGIPAVVVATVGSMAAPLQISPVGFFAAGSSGAPNDKALFYSGMGNFDVFSVNLDGTGTLNITQSAANESAPQWTDDGQMVIFTSDKNGRREVWRTFANGGAQTQITLNNFMPFNQGDFVTDVSPDGQLVAFRRQTSETFSEVGVISINGSGIVTFSSGAKNAQGAKFGLCP
jgi:Tol biopolymer transport system component